MALTDLCLSTYHAGCIVDEAKYMYENCLFASARTMQVASVASGNYSHAEGFASARTMQVASLPTAWILSA